MQHLEFHGNFFSYFLLSTIAKKRAWWWHTKTKICFLHPKHVFTEKISKGFFSMLKCFNIHMKYLFVQTCLIGLNWRYSSQFNRSWPEKKQKNKTKQLSSFFYHKSYVWDQGFSESATFQGGCVGQPRRHLLTLRMVIMKQMYLLWHWLFHKRTAKQSASLTYAEYKECIGEAGSNWKKKKKSATDTDLCYGSDCSITICFLLRCVKEFKRKKEVFSVFK